MNDGKSKVEINGACGSKDFPLVKMTDGGHAPAKRGFAAMNESLQRELASRGGKAAHQKGTAHEFNLEEARLAGRKGGEVVSRNREHMADIGRKGGATKRSL